MFLKLLCFAVCLSFSPFTFAKDIDDDLLEELNNSEFQVSLKFKDKESEAATVAMLAEKYARESTVEKNDGMVVAFRPSK